ncbi:hypothetical protein BGZ98_008410 [Dissophora globulifera]|nr:hypothetical protein BGZ98_008410 [Dissophora globulifera]
MRLSASIAVVALIALNANTAQAWGALGHTLTGQIAQQFLTPTTASKIGQILPAADDGRLSDVASWADKIRFLASFKWATPMHFFNPVGDDPPDHCTAGYVYAGQDNVNAVLNMTATLKEYEAKAPKTNASATVRQQALMFFVHFMGDLHQPLHDSSRLRGGNDAPIKWGGAKNNLHSLWDTLLIEKDVKDRFGNDPDAYLNDTLNLAHTYWTDAPTWTDCDPAQNTATTPWSATTDSVKTLCPIQWAADTNALDCSVVWVDYSPTRDYSKDYFQSVTGPSSSYLLQKQLAKSGVRMAAILNEIYDPSAKPPLTKRGLARLPSEH